MKDYSDKVEKNANIPQEKTNEIPDIKYAK